MISAAPAAAAPAAVAPEPAASVRPARIMVAPAATTMPWITWCSCTGPAPGGPRRARAGTAIAPATATTGSRPRNTHRHPNTCATSAASTGPASPGTTHAVDRTAIMRACSGPGKLRPIAA